MRLSVGQIVGAAAAVATVAGTYFAWREFVRSRDADHAAAANVIVCLESLRYEPGPPRRRLTAEGVELTLSRIVGAVDFRLVNLGGTAVTVTMVELNPVGTTRNGRHGGLSVDIPMQKRVEAWGSVAIPNLSFETREKFQHIHWVDEPTEVGTLAEWPGGRGDRLICRPEPWLCARNNDLGACGL